MGALKAREACAVRRSQACHVRLLCSQAVSGLSCQAGYLNSNRNE